MVFQTKVWVGRHFKKELAVAAAVDQLARGRTTERDAAKHKRSGMKPKLLFRLVALLSNERFHGGNAGSNPAGDAKPPKQ